MNVIIVGGGQVGGYIAGLLIENGNNAIVIENKEKALQALKKNGLKKENVLTGDGTDALLLEKAGVRRCNALVCTTGNDETNLAVAMMAKVAERTEMDINYRQRFYNNNKKRRSDITEAVCHATCMTAYELEAKSILTVTKSGRSARMISKYRPDCMITAGSTEEKVVRQLNMSWGVSPVLIKEKEEVLELFDYAVEVAKEKELVEAGDIVVITSGVPLGKSGTTNMIKVHTVE